MFLGLKECTNALTSRLLQVRAQLTILAINKTHWYGNGSLNIHEQRPLSHNLFTNKFGPRPLIVTGLRRQP
jgi:hypothetical protein